MSRVARAGKARAPEAVTSAIAISYNPEKHQAPVVVAKGRGWLARRIVESARAHGVAVISDPVALEALRFVDIGQEIPPRVYHMVAEILAFVYSLQQRAGRPAAAFLRGKKGAPGQGAPGEPLGSVGLASGAEHPLSRFI